jgi:hypothetical protein
VNFLFYRVFTKENATSFLRKISSAFLLQELRPLTPLKATDRFTSLTVIGMKKIICNNKHTVNLPVIEVEVIELQNGELILVDMNMHRKVHSDQSILKFAGYTVTIDGTSQRW